MQKRIISFILSLLMLLALSACGKAAPCSHQWQDASCAAPETCTLCGEVQGEALPHSFGSWLPGESDMLHVCTACGAEERAPTDHVLILNSLLQGTWDLESYSYGDKLMDAYSTWGEDIAAKFVRFFGEPTEKYVCSAEQVSNGVFPFVTEYYRNGVTITEGEVVRFGSFERNGETRTYRFTVSDAIGGYYASRYKLVLSPDDEPVLYEEFRYDGLAHTNTYSKTDELAAFAEGEWCAVYPGWDDGEVLHGLVLNPDRRVTGAIDGELHGAWSLRPLTKDQETGKYKFGIAILCFSDGFYGGFTPMSGGDTIWVGDSPDDLSLLKRENVRLHLNHEDEILDLFPAGLLSEPEKYQQESNDHYSIEGKWTSSLSSGVNILYYGLIKNNPELPAENRANCYRNDNTLEVLPDGTFTAKVIEGELSGTWEKCEAPEYLRQYHAAAFYEELEYYTFTGPNGEKFDAELCCFGNNASLQLSLHKGPVTIRPYERQTPLKYVFTRAID